jgi:hypothetical protein
MRDFGAVRFSAVSGLVFERAAILSIGQALTGRSPPDGKADVKSHVSFLWTAPLVCAPAVHDETSSGHLDAGLARTAWLLKPWFLKSWFLKPLHSDRP